MSLRSFVPRRRAPLLIAAALVVASIGGAVRLTWENTAGVRGASWDEVPAELGLDARDVSFAGAGGAALSGWWIPSTNGAAVVFTHGLKQDRGDLLSRAVVLARRGYGVLLYDLHAHGLSDGAVFGTSWRAVNDVLAAAAFVASQPDVDPARIGAFGFSVGAASTLRAAATSDPFAALFVDGASAAGFADEPPPTSMLQWALLPADAFYWPLLQLRLGVRAPASLTELLPRLGARPVVWVSGGPPRAVEHRRMLRYAARAKSTVAAMNIPEAGHGGGMAARPAAYGRALVSFFDAALLDGCADGVGCTPLMDERSPDGED